MIELIDHQALPLRRPERIGAVHALHEDAGNIAGAVADGIVGKIQEILLRWPARLIIEDHAGALGLMHMTIDVDLVQQVDEALLHDLRKRIGNRPADDIATANQPRIGVG